MSPRWFYLLDFPVKKLFVLLVNKKYVLQFDKHQYSTCERNS